MIELGVGLILTEAEFNSLATTYIVEEDAYTEDGYLIRYKDDSEEVYAEVSKNKDNTYTVTYME